MTTVKRVAIWILCMVLALGGTGCGNRSEGAVDTTVPAGNGQNSSTVTEELWEEQVHNATFSWQDNTLDPYTCVSKVVLPVENKERLYEYFIGGEMLSGSMWGRLCCYGEKDADRLEGETLYLLNDAGEVKAFPVETLDESIASKTFAKAGPSTEGTGCVLATNNFSQDGGRNCEIAVINEDGTLAQPLVVAQDSSVWNHYDRYDDFIADAQGNIHFTGNVNDEEKQGAYLVLDKEGNLLLEKQEPGKVSLQVLADGRIAAYVREKAGNEMQLQLKVTDMVGGEEEILAEWRAAENAVADCVTMLDENTLLVADENGVHACSTDGKVIETLYKWDNHGIRISLLGQMIVDEKGTIRIVYYTPEPDRENPQIPVLVCLQPVTEKREMLEIDFAVPAYNKESYEQAVVDFYRDYPNCKINLVTYEEESRLLTELVAGDGPVLVDTALVSFTENKELWECLDERLSDSSLDGVFLDKLLEAGQIDGSQYGLSPDWYLMTYAGIMEDISDWNQQEFLAYIKAHPEITSIYRNQSPMEFLIYFFFLNEKDCMFVDFEAGKAYFESEEFINLLALAKEVAKKSEAEELVAGLLKMEEGTRLGAMVDIFSPENLGSLEAMCSSELNYIGYPGADGSRHYIMAGSPITIRAGAEEWEKQAAMAFLEVLFSYDTQRQIQDMDMSTREDVLMAQIDNMNTSVSNMVNGENISMEIDAEKTREHILQLCEKGTIYPLEGSVLKDMILEELSSCFDGTKTAEEAAATLQNRAQLYLDENKMKE